MSEAPEKLPAAVDNVTAGGLGSRIGEVVVHTSPAIVRHSGLARVLEQFSEAVIRVGIISGFISGLLISGLAALMGAEIFARLIGYPLPFSWEYGGYMMGASFLFGGAFAACSEGHVRVSLLSAGVSDRKRRQLDLFSAALSSLVLATIFIGLVGLATQHLTRGTTSYTTMGTPLWVPVALMAAGAGALALQPLGWLSGILSGRVRVFVLRQNNLSGEG